MYRIFVFKRCLPCTFFRTFAPHNHRIMDQKNKDYTRRGLLLTLLTIGALIGISFIPGADWNGIKLKRINILSQIIADDSTLTTEPDLYFDTTFLAEGMAFAADRAKQEKLDQTHQTQESLNDSSYAADSLLEVPYTEDFGGSLRRFYNKLSSGNKNRAIRVAVLGDSYIEGDIITADLREHLQDMYGGNGVGFIPWSSPVALYRGTVQLSYGGWESRDVKYAKSTPSELRNRFYISGILSIPSEGAYTAIKGTNFRKHLKECSSARLLFVNRGNTAIRATINDTIEETYYPESDSTVQQILIDRPIRSLRLDLSNTTGFIGYGIVLESATGASVDNYSIRGNSGLALFGTNRETNSQIGALRNYDLVILEYGLNVLSPEVRHYGSYQKALTNIIRYVQSCFPGSSIMVMGVGDRSNHENGDFGTMPAVYGMIQAQRNAARATGVAFWNTFEAMGGTNSMVEFVRKQWAAKDYTHISYRGGKYIADKMFKSWTEGQRSHKERQQDSTRLHDQQLHWFRESDSEKVQ